MESTSLKSKNLLPSSGRSLSSTCHDKFTKYLLGNQYVGRVVHKGGISGVPRCVKHVTVIWKHIQGAKVVKVSYMLCG